MRVVRRRGARTSRDRRAVRVTTRSPRCRPRPTSAAPEAIRRGPGKRKHNLGGADTGSHAAPDFSIAAQPCREVKTIGFAWPPVEPGRIFHAEAPCRPRTKPSWMLYCGYRLLRGA